MMLVISVAFALLSISSGIALRTTRIQRLTSSNSHFANGMVFSPSFQTKTGPSRLFLVEPQDFSSSLVASDSIYNSESSFNFKKVLFTFTPVFASVFLSPKIAVAHSNNGILFSIMRNKKLVFAVVGIVLCGGLIAAFLSNFNLRNSSPREIVHIRKRPKPNPQFDVDTKEILIEDNRNTLVDIGRLSRKSGRINHFEPNEEKQNKLESTIPAEAALPPTPSTSSSSSPQADVPSPISLPDSQQSSGGLLKRWFGSQGFNGPNRSNNLSAALLLGSDSAESKDEQSLRRILLLRVLHRLPQDTVERIVTQDKTAVQYLQQGLQANENGDEQEDVNEYGSREDIAKVFADVANAVMVHAIDNAILRLEQSRSPEISSHTIKELFQVMDVTGVVFADVAAGVSNLAPLMYNGKMKKTQLEQLYLSGLTVRLQDHVLDVVNLDIDSDDAQNDKKDKASSTEHFDQSLGQLQFLCNIKESRRAQLEQKSFMNLLMSQNTPTNDSAEFPDFANLKKSNNPFAALSELGDLGKLEGLLKNRDDMNMDLGGLGDMESLAEVEKLLKSIDPAERQKLFEDVLKNADGMPGFPDLSKMQPEEIEKMTQEALRNFKSFASNK